MRRSQLNFALVQEPAIPHILREMSLGNIEKSLRMMYQKARRSHNAIHQLMLVGPNLFPRQSPHVKTFEWHRNSAFITYHWETFHLAHASFQQALCGCYNAAFILLRASLELLVRGAFFDCLAHKRFRDNSCVLDREQRSTLVKESLLNVIRLDPAIENDLERASIAIYDKLEHVMDDPKFRIPVKTMIEQLSKWNIFQGISNTSNGVWSLYSMLSKDVHVIPDRTDIGKVLIYAPRDLFKTPRLMRRTLSQYLDALTETMDIGIALTINLLRDNVERYEEARQYLRRLTRDPEFRRLLLRQAPRVVRLALHNQAQRTLKLT